MLNNIKMIPNGIDKIKSKEEAGKRISAKEQFYMLSVEIIKAEQLIKNEDCNIVCWYEDGSMTITKSDDECYGCTEEIYQNLIQQGYTIEDITDEYIL